MTDNKNCLYILSEIESAGFEAYLVGGCVRDMLMNRKVNDYDITTNALPEDICGIFSSDKVIPTGIKHGTVTVIVNGEPFEITTFRVDGEYSDFRHPDSIKFTTKLSEDLARRDFTMNAIAMDMNGEIYDYYHGREDIENRIIRCVGNAEERLKEDPLRIIRAVRFASVLGFEIEKETADSVHKMKSCLDNISVERITVELVKLLGGENCVDILMKYRDIIGQIIPELIPEFDFEQHSRYHRYDVYEHTVRAVNAVKRGIDNENEIRIAMLLHDCAKPDMFYLDENGTGHFKGHAEKGAVKAEKILHRLKFDNKTIVFVREIIARHSDKIETDNQIKRLINKYGTEFFLSLIEVKKADNLAKQEFVLQENVEFDRFAETAVRLTAEGSCMSLAALEINGNDLISLGFRGKAVGDCLNRLLDSVMNEEIENNHEKLMEKAGEILK